MTASDGEVMQEEGEGEVGHEGGEGLASGRGQEKEGAGKEQVGWMREEQERSLREEGGGEGEGQPKSFL